MVIRIRLTLEQDKFGALMKSAIEELRNSSDQAHFIIRQDLTRRGFFHPQTEQCPKPEQFEAVGDAA